MWYCLVGGYAKFFFINGKTYTVGRNKSCHCNFPDIKFISREHLHVTFVHSRDIDLKDYETEQIFSTHSDLVKSHLTTIGERPTIARIDCLGQSGCTIDTYRSRNNNNKGAAATSMIANLDESLDDDELYEQVGESLTMKTKQHEFFLDEGTSRFVVSIRGGANKIALDFRYRPGILIAHPKRISSSSTKESDQQELEQQMQTILALKKNCFRLGYSLLLESDIKRIFGGQNNNNNNNSNNMPLAIASAFTCSPSVGALVTDDLSPNFFFASALASRKPIIAFDLINKYVESHLAQADADIDDVCEKPLPSFTEGDSGLFPPVKDEFALDRMRSDKERFDSLWMNTEKNIIRHDALIEKILPLNDANQKRFAVFNNSTFVTISQKTASQLEAIVQLCKISQKKVHRQQQLQKNRENDGGGGGDGADNNDQDDANAVPEDLDITVTFDNSFHSSNIQQWVQEHSDSSDVANQSKNHILVISEEDSMSSETRKQIDPKMQMIRMVDVYHSLFLCQRSYKLFWEKLQRSSTNGNNNNTQQQQSKSRRRRGDEEGFEVNDLDYQDTQNSQITNNTEDDDGRNTNNNNNMNYEDDFLLMPSFGATKARKHLDAVAANNKNQRNSSSMNNNNNLLDQEDSAVAAVASTDESQQSNNAFGNKFGAQAAAQNTRNLFVNNNNNNNTNGDSTSQQQAPSAPKRQQTTRAAPKKPELYVSDKNVDFPENTIAKPGQDTETEEQKEERRNKPKFVVDDTLMISKAAQPGLPGFPCYRQRVTPNYHHNNGNAKSQKTFKKQRVLQYSSGNNNNNNNNLFFEGAVKPKSALNTFSSSDSGEDNENEDNINTNNNANQRKNNKKNKNGNNNTSRRLQPLPSGDIERRLDEFDRFQARRIDADDLIPDDYGGFFGEIDQVERRRNEAFDYCFDHQNAKMDDVLMMNSNKNNNNNASTTRARKSGGTAAAPKPAAKRQATTTTTKRATGKKTKADAAVVHELDDDDDEKNLTSDIDEADESDDSSLMMMSSAAKKGRNAASSSSKTKKAPSPKKTSPKKSVAAAPRGKKAGGKAAAAVKVAEDAAPVSIFDIDSLY